MARNSHSSIDLISIGDSTLDVFLQISEASVSCQLNKEQCLLCLEYAEKIPVDSVHMVAGAGNASNIAVAMRRLNKISAIASIIGDDKSGRDMLANWKSEHVLTHLIRIDRAHESNYSTVLNYKGERTILVYSQPRTYRLPSLPDTKWIYYTALGTKHLRIETQLMNYLERHPQTSLAFNPGRSHIDRGVNALKSVIARSTLFIVNKEEADHLTRDGERPIQNLLLFFRHIGARVVVITDGARGAYAADESGMWHCPIFPGRIYERTGAGDSFATGCLYGLMQKWPLPESLRGGTANAWSVVKKIGPQAGLLHEPELMRTLHTFSRIKPTRLSS